MITKSIFSLLLFFLTSLFSFSQTVYKKVIKVEYYACSMLIKTKIPMSAEHFKTRTDNFRATYYTAESVEDIILNIPKLKISKYQGANVRELCEIYYVDGSVDSFGIDSTKMIVYNGKRYKKNRKIYKNIRNMYPVKRFWVERLFW